MRPHRSSELASLCAVAVLGSAGLAPPGRAAEPPAVVQPGAAPAAGAGPRPALTAPDFTPSLPAYDGKEVAKLEAALLSLADDSPRKPELSFRLGQLYWSHAKALAAAGDQVVGQRELSKAILNFLGLTRRKGYDRADEALFDLGVMHVAAGKEDQARKYLLRLQKEFPSSRRASNAYLIFGEYYFGVDAFDVALTYYDKVLQLRAADTWPFAAYRRAWTLQLLRRTKEAAAAFAECARPDGPGTDAAATRIRQECRADAIRLAGSGG